MVANRLIHTITSLFHEPKRTLRLNGENCEHSEIKKGIKLGNGPSPLLFTIYKDRLPKVCKRWTQRVFEVESDSDLVLLCPTDSVHTRLKDGAVVLS